MNSLPPPTPERRRASVRRSRRSGRAKACSAPALIGVGVDGTSSGCDAVVLGSLLALPTAAELMLIAVAEEPLMQVVLPHEMDFRRREQQTWAMLAQTRDSLAPDARIVVESDVLIWRALRHVVRREHRDLLVVGSARDADDRRVRLGRTARELFSHLECPLAIAPSGMRNRGTSHVKRIGVGFDGEPESRAALGLAIAIASTAGAHLHIRSVADDQIPRTLRAEEAALEGDTIVAERVTSLLERELAGARAIGTRTHVDFVSGDPAEALKALATQIDLLVLGSDQSGLSGRVQLGHTGHAILHDAPCPTLIVPRPRAHTGPQRNAAAL